MGGSQSDEGPSWVDAFEVEQSKAYAYTTSLHWSLTQFTPASMEIHPTNTAERVYAVCTLLFAMVVFSSFVSSITASMTQIRHHQSDMEQSCRELRNFFTDKQVSSELYQRIWHHLRHSQWSSRRSVHEKDLKILATLPENLKSKLRDELHSPVLIKAPFLLRISTNNIHGMSALCYQAVTETTVLPTEELFVDGKMAHKMYFVHVGSMEYVRLDFRDEETKEFLKEGQRASEPALWMHWLHCGTLSAKCSCEVLELDSEGFRTILLTHDRSLSFLSRYALLFHEHMSHTKDWATDLWNQNVLESLAEAAEGRKVYLADRGLRNSFRFLRRTRTVSQGKFT